MKFAWLDTKAKRYGFLCFTLALSGYFAYLCAYSYMDAMGHEWIIHSHMARYFAAVATVFGVLLGYGFGRFMMREDARQYVWKRITGKGSSHPDDFLEFTPLMDRLVDEYPWKDKVRLGFNPDKVMINMNELSPRLQEYVRSLLEQADPTSMDTKKASPAPEGVGDEDEEIPF